MLIVKMDNYHWQHMWIVLNELPVSNFKDLVELNNIFISFESTVVKFEIARDRIDQEIESLSKVEEGKEQDMIKIGELNLKKTRLNQEIVEVKMETKMRDSIINKLDYKFFNLKDNSGRKGLVTRREQSLALNILMALISAESEFKQVGVENKTVNWEEVKK